MVQIPRAEKGRTCPLLKQDMSKVCHACPLWVQVRGTNPNTGEAVDRWDCAHAIMPILTIENTMQQRSTAAAIESFRNEMVVDRGLALAQLATADRKLIDVPPRNRPVR